MRAETVEHGCVASAEHFLITADCCHQSLAADAVTAGVMQFRSHSATISGEVSV